MTALIIGVTGQDGLYLTKFLLKKNYRIVGMIQKGLQVKPSLMEFLTQNIQIVYGDLRDIESLIEAIDLSQPDEIYNLAALSHSGESWQSAIDTAEITGVGAHRVFEAVKEIKKNSRIFQASSSEMFGLPKTIPQNEETPFAPVSPYGAAKLYAHTMAQIYNRSHNLFIACGILFNHESPYRTLNFLTQKVAYGVACIKLGIHNSNNLNEHCEPVVQNGKIKLGNLDAQRDWGYAGDFVEAMWLMLQQEKPDSFVIGTGIAHTVRELCEFAFNAVGLNWENYIITDKKFYRPVDSATSLADTRKAEKYLGWKAKTSLSELMEIMVNHQIQQLQKQ